MKTRIAICVTVFGQIDSKKLYEELKDLHVNVIDIGKETYVFALVDMRNFNMNRVLLTCSKYGEVDIECNIVV